MTRLADTVPCRPRPAPAARPPANAGDDLALALTLFDTMVAIARQWGADPELVDEAVRQAERLRSGG